MLFTILKIWAVALGVLFYTGWGAASLLTPRSLGHVKPLVVPFFGYALVTLVLYYLLWLGLAVDRGRWVLLAVATFLNGGAWWLARKEQGPRFDWQEIGIAMGLGVAAGVIAVLPLLAHGVLAPIGDSWDVEFYLPLAAYLRHYAYMALDQAPQNPLVGVIQVDPTFARAIGFAYFQALVDGIRDWDALRTFSPLLGFMRLLAAPALFLFARYGLGLRRWTAALATAFVAVNELLLWVQYTGFAMHVSSMPLVPIALLLTILALRECRVRTTVGAAVLLAMIAVNYHPALLGYGALAAGAGVWSLVSMRRKRAVLLHGFAIVAGAAAATWLVQVRANRAFFKVYEQGASALGTPGYIHIWTLLRLTPLANAEAPAAPPWGHGVIAAWPAVIGSALVVAGLLGVLWLWRSRGERGLALTMLGMAVIYGLGLRYVAAFPYGHMKGLSFISFVPLAVVAGGCEVVARAGRGRLVRRGIAGALVALLLVVMGSTAWSSFLRVSGGPGLYGREQLRFLELPRIIPPGASVLLSGDEGLRGPTMGLAAYALREHPLYGRTATGYQVFEELPAGVSPAFLLLAPNEDATAWGVSGAPLWQSAVAALYRAPEGRLAHLRGELAQQAYPTALHRNSALELAVMNQAPFHELQKGVDIAVGSDSLGYESNAGGGTSARRMLVLEVGTVKENRLHVRGPGVDRRIVLPAGVTMVQTMAMTTPTMLQLQSDQPALLRWVDLYTEGAQPPAQQAPVKLVRTDVTAQPGGAQVRLQVGPGADRLRMGVEIYTEGSELRHYGWGVFDLQSGTLGLDIAHRAVTLNGKPAPFQWAPRQNGRYFAALWVYHGQSLIERLPLFSFDDRNGEIKTVTPLGIDAAWVAATQPTTVQHGTFQGVGQLTGLSWSSARAGGTAQVAVWWQASGAKPGYFVTAQLLGSDNHKWAAWDGLLGGDGVPSSGWSAGDRVRQDIPLRLDPQMPTGMYRLLIGVYRPEDGKRVPVVGAGGEAPGDGVVVEVTAGK
ncbi:MAG: hypothetical protein NVS4B8_15180 [Herpetosiphon sp.]